MRDLQDQRLGERGTSGKSKEELKPASKKGERGMDTGAGAIPLFRRVWGKERLLLHYGI